MRDTKNFKIFAAALLMALAASTSYSAQSRPAQNGPLAVIALQTHVDGRPDTYGVKPAEPIPVAPGERVRIHLVGTAIIQGTGVERPIPADFSIAAGRDKIDIVQTGTTWVTVQVSPGANGVAQIGYEVTGNEYEMKGGLRGGRLTLEIGAGLTPSPGSVGTGTGSADRVRWNRSRDLTDQLYRTILGAAPQGDTARRDLEHIYEMGAIGVRDVALALAHDADARYDRLSQDDAVNVLGDLYRGLLRRTLSNSQLWDQDPGFRDNVDNLRRRGYEQSVRGIIEAPEFRIANNLDDFGYLAGHDNDASWRTRPIRYAVPN